MAVTKRVGAAKKAPRRASVKKPILQVSAISVQLAGVVSVVLGVALISRPAALILGGALAIFVVERQA